MDPLRDSLERITATAALCNAPTWLVEELGNPKAVIEMKVRAMTRTGKQSFDAVRVHQTNPYPTGTPHPFKGGLRYMWYPSSEEMIRAMRALANDMTLKNALYALPFGGAKGCLLIKPEEFTEEELEEITKELTFEALCKNTLDPDGDVWGPDYATDAKTMLWIYIQYGRFNQLLHRPNPSAVVTGKPIEFDGCPGREDATARGGLILIQEILKPQGVPRIAVQGFGNVGSNFCRLVESDPYWNKGIVVAVSDATGGVYNPHGLLFEELIAHHSIHKGFTGCSLGDFIKPEEIIYAGEYDIFVTAAKEGLIDETNARLLKTKHVVELGNSAITLEADHILDERGVTVLPDIMANAGGVIVSSFEWRRNRGDIYHAVDLALLEQWVYDELIKILRARTKSVLRTQTEFNTTLRTAAYITALRQLEFLLRAKHGYR